MMFEELLFHPAVRGAKDGPALSWLIFLSLIRDDFPWVYEPGMDLYRALRAGKRVEIQKAHKNLLNVVRMTTHSKFLHRLIRGEDESAMFALRHLDEFVDRLVHQ